MNDYRGIVKSLFFTKREDLLRDRYSRTKDRDTLIELVSLQDFPEAPDAARELAKQYQDTKADRDIEWREIDRLYAYFNEKMTDAQFYAWIADIYREDKPNLELNDLKKEHKKWAKKAFEALPTEQQKKISGKI
jgi:hypothetical protein